jgi:hypothetical protein
MIEDSLLDHLLRGGHISMDERIEKGAWPHAPF